MLRCVFLFTRPEYLARFVNPNSPQSRSNTTKSSLTSAPTCDTIARKRSRNRWLAELLPVQAVCCRCAPTNQNAGDGIDPLAHARCFRRSLRSFLSRQFAKRAGATCTSLIHVRLFSLTSTFNPTGNLVGTRDMLSKPCSIVGSRSIA
jgi:hypothetical protein